MQSTFEAVVVPLKYNEQGVVHISGTRVTLDSIMHAYDEGATPEEIACRFPTLKLEDIYTVIVCNTFAKQSGFRWMNRTKEAGVSEELLD